jgi:predicted nuclease with TOPRIM domain
LQSLKALQDNKDMTAVLTKINSAAKQVGMATVIEEMRPGGKYADLRREFNVALNENTHIATDYDNAGDHLKAYANQRSSVNEILKARPQARKDFDELDQDIVKSFLGLPGKKDRQSALDEAADKVKEVLENAINAVRAAFGRNANQTATTRLSPGPSPGP